MRQGSERHAMPTLPSRSELALARVRAQHPELGRLIGMASQRCQPGAVDAGGDRESGADQREGEQLGAALAILPGAAVGPGQPPAKGL